MILTMVGNLTVVQMYRCEMTAGPSKKLFEKKKNKRISNDNLTTASETVIRFFITEKIGGTIN